MTVLSAPSRLTVWCLVTQPSTTNWMQSGGWTTWNSPTVVGRWSASSSGCSTRVTLWLGLSFFMRLSRCLESFSNRMVFRVTRGTGAYSQPNCLGSVNTRKVFSVQSVLALWTSWKTSAVALEIILNSSTLFSLDLVLGKIGKLEKFVIYH